MQLRTTLTLLESRKALLGRSDRQEEKETMSSSFQVQIAKVNDLYVDLAKNARLLELCRKPHEFVLMNGKDGRPAEFECMLCGGKVHPTDAIWYKRGLNDSKMAKIR